MADILSGLVLVNPGHEVVQLRGHFLRVVGGIELVVHFVRQSKAFLLGVVSDTRNPAMRDSRRENADFVLAFRGTHGTQSQTEHQRKNNGKDLFHTFFPPIK